MFCEMKLGKADNVDGNCFMLGCCYVYLNYNGVTTRCTFMGMHEVMVKRLSTENIGYNDGMFVVNHHLGIIKDGKVEVGGEFYSEQN